MPESVVEDDLPTMREHAHGIVRLLAAAVAAVHPR